MNMGLRAKGIIASQDIDTKLWTRFNMGGQQGRIVKIKVSKVMVGGFSSRYVNVRSGTNMPNSGSSNC